MLPALAWGHASRQTTNTFALDFKARTVLCSIKLELDMSGIANKGQEESPTLINESAQAWPCGRRLIIIELRMKESRLFRHEISDWPSLNHS